jgi:hypothetical protein
MMTPTTFEHIPRSEQERIKAMVDAHLKEMSATDRAILNRTRESLAYYIAEVVRSFAALLGYTIAVPLAFADKMARSFADGFSQGWNDAWRDFK